MAAGADYLLPVKENQPALRAEAESYFASAPRPELDIAQSLDKAHGRLEIRSTRSPGRSAGWIRIAPFPAQGAFRSSPSSA